MENGALLIAVVPFGAARTCAGVSFLGSVEKVMLPVVRGCFELLTMPGI